MTEKGLVLQHCERSKLCLSSLTKTLIENIKMNTKDTDGWTMFMIVLAIKNRKKLWTTSLCPLIQAFINEVFPLISSPFKSIFFAI